MSVFISYNYASGHETALALAAELERHGIDAWWLPDPVSRNQLDGMVENALAGCQRCVVIWSLPALSQWQIIEIEAIRQRLLLRRPPTEPTDFFLVLRNRGRPDIPADGRLPLLENSEYHDYGPAPGDVPDLGHLAGFVPGTAPLTGGGGRRPHFHPPRDAEPVAGHQVLTGGFSAGDPAAPRRYCWVFLEDVHDNWYVQQPRPTVTHSRRWIAPSVNVGQDIRAAVLVALGPDGHRRTVRRVLAGHFGGFPKTDLADAEEIDRLPLSPGAMADRGSSAAADWAYGLPQGAGAEDADALLDALARKAFLWFQDHCHPETGMVKDRGGNFPGRGSRWRMSSIASTGYHLSLLPCAVRRGWLDEGQARAAALRAMRFAAERLEHRFGLLCHFIDWETGARWGRSEWSLLDTAIFLNGCMVAAGAFPDLGPLADALLDRVDWTQYVVTHPATGKRLLSFGWTPDEGGKLLSPADVRSTELAMPYFLAAGSRRHAVAPELWYNTAVVVGDVCGHRILNPEHALFTSYYGLGWADLRGLVDREGVDLDANARQAALANRAYCRSVAARRFATYAEAEGGWWGLSAGDSPAGYVAPGPVHGDPDGTVWPTAALAALPWVPEVIAEDLPRWRSSTSWPRVAGRYGLSPFSLEKRWVGEDVIGIDLGSYAVSWANHRDGGVSELWMRHPVAKAALEQLGYSRRAP